MLSEIIICMCGVAFFGGRGGEINLLMVIIGKSFLKMHLTCFVATYKMNGIYFELGNLKF